MENKEQTIVEHLRELRKRVVRSGWGIFVGMLLVYNFTDKIFDFLRAPIAKYLPSSGLVFTAPMDKFMAHLKIAAFGGLIIAGPWWLFQIWKFIAPGLYTREKKYAVTFICVGTLLFVTVISFCYFLVFPAAF